VSRSTLQHKFNSQSGVTSDEEMSRVLSLENSFAANPRLMLTVNQMFDTLMQV